jgi:hypothetical protein
MKRHKRNAIAPLLSSSASKIVALLLIAFGVMAEAQAQLKVSVMPSHSQSANYGKAAINEAITVWGRTWGGLVLRPMSSTLVTARQPPQAQLPMPTKSPQVTPTPQGGLKHSPLR